MTTQEKREAAKAQSEREAATLAQIGGFVFWFSQIEGALRFALAGALNLPEELYDAVTASYDFRTLCAVTLAACRFRDAGDPTKIAAIEKLISRCKKMNDTRVHIVHGIWQPSSTAGFSAKHMSRQSLTVHELYNDPRAISQAVQECRKLSQDALEVFFF